jgi:hypothetical protein
LSKAPTLSKAGYTYCLGPSIVVTAYTHVSVDTEIYDCTVNPLTKEEVVRIAKTSPGITGIEDRSVLTPFFTMVPLTLVAVKVATPRYEGTIKLEDVVVLNFLCWVEGAR